MEDVEKKIFEIICNYEASIMNDGYPTPSTCINKVLGISLYKTRKALKALKEKGLIQSCRCSMYSDMDERYILLSGYSLTKLGKQTEEYKQAEQREIELIDKIWGNKNEIQT